MHCFSKCGYRDKICFLCARYSKKFTPTMSLTKLFLLPSGVYKERRQDCKLRGAIHLDKAMMCASIGLMLSILSVKVLVH